MKYIITTGWWCDDIKRSDNRETYNGSDDIRKVSFFEEWYKAVKTYTSPDKIIVIDSNSPLKPDISNKSDVDMISLSTNAGHSSNHIGAICGVTRAHIMGMTLALCSDVDYWVYIEQDALISGYNIVETAISQSKNKIIFGNGLKTPQPTQQSFMIIHRDKIPAFINEYMKISKKDYEISPEMKFGIASTAWARFLPEYFFLEKHGKKRLGGYWLRLLNYMFNKFGGYDHLPFGYGRERPINFTDDLYYFQHASKEELQEYKKLNENIKNN